jgi:hypothetical protein
LSNNRARILVGFSCFVDGFAQREQRLATHFHVRLELRFCEEMIVPDLTFPSQQFHLRQRLVTFNRHCTSAARSALKRQTVAPDSSSQTSFCNWQRISCISDIYFTFLNKAPTRMMVICQFGNMVSSLNLCICPLKSEVGLSYFPTRPQQVIAPEKSDIKGIIDQTQVKM